MQHVVDAIDILLLSICSVIIRPNGRYAAKNDDVVGEFQRIMADIAKKQKYIIPIAPHRTEEPPINEAARALREIHNALDKTPNKKTLAQYA